MEQKHDTIVITKRGTPLAKLVPYEEKETRLFGFLKGSGVIKGDIIDPLDENWNLLQPPLGSTATPAPEGS